MSDEKKNEISTILDTSMTDLKQNNKEAYEIIINKSEEGFFQGHQTTGKLKGFAKDILEISGFYGQKDESQKH
ncbi:MAG TPA: hypothetical protein VGA85_01480 [Dehalococcoidales bacterium]